MAKAITLVLSQGTTPGSPWLQHSVPPELNEMIVSHEWKWKHSQSFLLSVECSDLLVGDQISLSPQVVTMRTPTECFILHTSTIRSQ